MNTAIAIIHPTIFIGLKPCGITKFIEDSGFGGKRYSVINLEAYVNDHYPHLLIKKRTRDLVCERHALMDIIYKHRAMFGGLSYKMIAGFFGGQDHSTFIHARGNVKVWFEMPEHYAECGIVYAKTEKDFLNYFN